jgi:hypothetical protein
MTYDEAVQKAMDELGDATEVDKELAQAIRNNKDMQEVIGMTNMMPTNLTLTALTTIGAAIQRIRDGGKR